MRTLLKSTDGGASWSEPRSDGNTASYITLAIDPGTPASLYAGTGNGVIKSTDGGQTWQPDASLLENSSVHNLAIDPGSPASLYALVPEEDPRYIAFSDLPPSGLFKSNNGGLAWKKTASEPEFGHTNCLAFDPHNPETVFAGTRQGLFKSTDGGGSWQPANRGLTAMTIFALEANPLSPTTLYAAAGEAGVYKSTAGAEQWQAVNAGLPHGSLTNLVIDPLSPDTLYAVEGQAGSFSHYSSEDNYGIFKSNDAGETWQALSNGLPDYLTVTSLVIDPGNPSTLYAGTFSDGVFKTSDGGGSWRAINAGMVAGTVNCLAIDPLNPANLFAGSYEGFYQTTDGGENWVEIISGPDHTTVHTLTLDPNAPATIYAGTWPGGLYKSTDGGASWLALGTGLGNDTFASLVVSPQDSQTLYGVGRNTGMDGNSLEADLTVYVSHDGGETWSRVETGLTDVIAYSLLADPDNPGGLYLGTSQGVYRGTYLPNR